MHVPDHVDPPLLVEDRGIHRRLVINRSRKANALNEATLAALELAVIAASKDENIRLLEITGAGERVFCAGADLTEAGGQTTNAQLAQAFDARWDRVTTAIEDLSCVTVACINGACIGGGLSIALACDFRVASENASFSYPAATHGFMPSPADVERLMRLVGMAQTKSILLLGQRKSAAEAMRIGLVEVLTQHASMTVVVSEVKQAIELGNPIAQLAIKRLIGSAPLTSSTVQDCYRAVYDTDMLAAGRLRRAGLHPASQ